MGDVTQILTEIENGDSAAAERLLPLVYDELRRLAAAKMAQESPDHTLQPTALVHEAYVRLVDVPDPQHWDGRRHFFVAAAEAMRRILVERARRKAGPKGGGGLQRIDLSDVEPEVSQNALQLLSLNSVLDKLEAHDPRAAQVVKLRFFAGFTRQQVAAALGMSVSTVDDDWVYAKGWLRVEMS
jgi:RNA polymerase sigma factor (TIGR02999 family)